MRDDGVGIHVVRELEVRRLPPNVEVHDGKTNAFEVLEYMDGRDKAIIIDAYQTGAKPGTIHRFTFDPDKAEYNSALNLSMHDINFVDALRAGKKAYRLPREIVIIGVEPEVLDYGLELSPEVKKAVPNIIKTILSEIAQG